MPDLAALLAQSCAHHSHLCPRQVLGVRIGLAGAAALDLSASRPDRRLLVIVETDGCFTSGIQAAAGVSVAQRTLRVEDYGKIAATFVDVRTERALRVWPRPGIRQRARSYAPEEPRRYFAQLAGYQIMPVSELLCVQEVRLSQPVQALVGRAGVRAECACCGEEIINQRELLVDGQILCRACAAPAPYLYRDIHAAPPAYLFTSAALPSAAM